jgi:hypothetical protein
MLVTLKFRERLRAVAQVIVDELEQVVASITTGWRVAHNDDGTHKGMTVYGSLVVQDGDASRLYLSKTDAPVRLWLIAANDTSWIVYNVTAGYTAPLQITSSGAVTIPGTLTTNGGLQTFGANDSAGAGYRYVVVPNA